MRIVVSDSSCLIDLRKASLLDTFLRLPYEFLIPNTLFEEELLKFTAAQKKALIRGRSKGHGPSGREGSACAGSGAKDSTALRSRRICFRTRGESPRLYPAHGRQWASDTRDSACNGSAWHIVVIDQIHGNRLTSSSTLLTALHPFSADPTVRLPRRELGVYIKRYEKMK